MSALRIFYSCSFFRILLTVLLATYFVLSPSGIVSAKESSLLLRDSFLIGDEEGTLCRVQTILSDRAVKGMFDRAWVIICHDATQTIGTVRALHTSEREAKRRLVALREGSVECDTEQGENGNQRNQSNQSNQRNQNEVSRGDSSNQNETKNKTICRLRDSDTAWEIHREQHRNTVYVAEGYAAYSDALRLALASIIKDAIQPGTIHIATTLSGQQDGFARNIARVIDVDKALAEAYRQNHNGEYAAAAAFFSALMTRFAGDSEKLKIDPSEFLLNRALQKSNLGEFEEATRLFKLVEAMPTTDSVQQRLRRNFRAIDALNRGDLSSATAILSTRLTTPLTTPLSSISTVTGTLGEQESNKLVLTKKIVDGLNSGVDAGLAQQINTRKKLTATERVMILDAQAVHLSGVIERLRRNGAAAREAQLSALSSVLAVRGGRVVSIVRLRAQMLGELALAEELLGNVGQARKRFLEAIDLLTVEYPKTPALVAAISGYGAFLVRQGDIDSALARYSTILTMLVEQRVTLTALDNKMAPYFRILAERSKSDDSTIAAAALDDFFLASQFMNRSGAADTQATLARELSSGSDEGARLFRQATNLTRYIEQARIKDGRLAQLPASAPIVQQRSELAARIASLNREQVQTLAELAQFPQYQAVENGQISLTDFRSILQDGEAYVKTLVTAHDVYTLYVTLDDAQVWRTAIENAELDQAVDRIRASISVNENGRTTTYPFDAVAARSLYRDLFGPIENQLASKHHLIYDPDGAMRRLPISLLVVADTGLEDFIARVNDPDADPFDTRDIVFLGRSARASTALSPIAFRNARRLAPSRAPRQYMGLGSNDPLTTATIPASNRSDAESEAGCFWPAVTWNNPISSRELITAQKIFGRNESRLLIGDSFTDDDIRQRSDISHYRILHFATHGLVTAPQPQCPTRPALLTSFGDNNSDGLLSFDEIFDMKIDADLVILSACDTANAASVVTTREAGVSTGGGTALDGLVRAFIGAGGRSVIASHWPVPDDFNATERLIGGLFSVPQGSSVAESLWSAQKRLMESVNTSHPYYWAGFVIVGDGEKALLHQKIQVTKPTTEPVENNNTQIPPSSHGQF